MIWVTVEDVIAVHSRIIKASGAVSYTHLDVYKRQPFPLAACNPLPMVSLAVCA